MASECLNKIARARYEMYQVKLSESILSPMARELVYHSQSPITEVYSWFPTNVKKDAIGIAIKIRNPLKQYENIKPLQRNTSGGFPG